MNPYANAPTLPEGNVLLDDLLPEPKGSPFEIEIGPGRGMFALERVAARPDVRYLALEIRKKWAQILDERLAKKGLGKRARSLAEDAKQALPRLGPDASVQTIFVLFPDPWWKKKHQKRLVVGDVLITEIVRLLQDNGELFVQTDVEERANEYSAQIALISELEPAGDEPGSFVLQANPYQAKTNREKRADEDGLPVHRMRWRRRPR